MPTDPKSVAEAHAFVDDLGRSTLHSGLPIQTQRRLWLAALVLSSRVRELEASTRTTNPAPLLTGRADVAAPPPCTHADWCTQEDGHGGPCTEF